MFNFFYSLTIFFTLSTLIMQIIVFLAFIFQYFFIIVDLISIIFYNYLTTHFIGGDYAISSIELYFHSPLSSSI